MSPREATPVGTTVLRMPLTTRMLTFAAVALFSVAALWRLTNSPFSGGSLVATIVLVLIALICIASLPLVWKYAVWTSPDGDILYVRLFGPKSTRSVELRAPTKVTVKRVGGRSGLGPSPNSQLPRIIVTVRRPGQPTVQIRTPGVPIRPLMRLLQPALEADPSLAADDRTAEMISDPNSISVAWLLTGEGFSATR